MVGISGRSARTIFQVNRNPRDHVRRGTEQQMSRKNIKLSILYQAESTTMIPLVEKLHKHYPLSPPALSFPFVFCGAQLCIWAYVALHWNVQFNISYVAN